ncbi:HTTM domain-containing protein [Lysinibacillus xylanilyticus]|uniref:HTTM domain-containing protein n=1 Tax=Lysinibacillus xylanilyticus TaxID=582475 RepID=UPI002B24D831|nr:HTTM domain-containing protein [Lysinibacillus xylanilyticus]MEB2300321.1 HTTM domain-containing protein [Lysinibacillus xylanilyticus]
MKTLTKFTSFLSKPYITIGASLVRIGFGLLLIYFYVIHYSQRDYLWGPNGLIDFNEFIEILNNSNSFSLYALSNSELYFDIIFHIGIIAALLFTLGYKGRFISIVNFILVFSIHERNHMILDGGDNITRILLFYLIFAQTTKHFSIDSYLAKKRNKSSESSFYSNALHNVAVLASITQLCVLYLNSAYYKVMGEVWQNGTAIYYILQVEEFSHPFFRSIISSSDFLIVVGTYGTLLVQMAFPFLLFNKKTKYIGLILVVGMHLGIAIVMGLYTFSATMLVIDLLLISNEDYRKAYKYLNSLATKLLGRKVSEKNSKAESTLSS